MSESSPPAIPAFTREFFDAEDTFTRIGDGALGGKATGLLTVRDHILSQLTPDDVGSFETVVPTLTVITTHVFDIFMQRNRLLEIALSGADDDRIAHAFQRGTLPAEVVGDLRALISRVHTPLAVRSSSLLEDALDHPFAGVYATKMIPNNEIEEDARFSRLEEAIKFVFASTFFREARAYIKSVGQDSTAEKMAVIVQEIVGQRRGNRYYPSLSGVARSYNYYPTGHGKAEDGVVNLALGLGKTIVDGGLTWGYSPQFPKAPPPFNDVGDLLKNTQTRFFAVNMGEPPLPDPIAETEFLVQPTLADAEADGAVKHLVSTYDPASDRLNPGIGGRGARALTFAPILTSPFARFNDLVRRLLDLSKEALGTAVELEFAANFGAESLFPARFGFLQVRPMMVAGESVDVDMSELSAESTVVGSTTVLGNGIRNDLCDVVFVKPETFDRAATPRMAMELERINDGLAAAGRSYILIGFGRWGTSDHWLGVPVTWPQIGNARVIVEATLPDVNPDMSQGSHFFHNVLSFKVLYFSVAHHGPYPIRWEWLSAQETETETEHIKHIRTPHPLVVRVDGSTRRGVVSTDG